MNLKLARLLVMGLVLCFAIDTVASSSATLISLQEAVRAFSTNSPAGKEQIYMQVETHVKNAQGPILLHEAIMVLGKIAAIGNVVERYETLCLDNAVSCSNDMFSTEFIAGFARSPRGDTAPQIIIDRLDEMLLNQRNPSIRFRLAVAKAKADVFTLKMKDDVRGIRVLENFIDESGTNKVMKISAMVKQLEIYRVAQKDNEVEGMAKKLYAIKDCPDFAFIAAAIALSDLNVRRGEISKAGNYLIDVLEKSNFIPVGFSGRFVKIKAEEKVVERAIGLIRKRIANVPVRDLRMFNIFVERWQPEVIKLLTYLGRGEEAMAECRVLMFFSSEKKYKNAVELTAKTFKIFDGNLGRASAFMNFQKKGIVPEQLNVMMEPTRLCDDVRSEYRKRLSVLQDDQWEDLLVYSQKLLWLDDPYGSVECALKAFSMAPFATKSLQSCSNAAMKPLLSVTRDPAVAQKTVDYLLYGVRGRDGVINTDDDLKNPLDAWGARLKTEPRR